MSLLGHMLNVLYAHSLNLLDKSKMGTDGKQKWSYPLFYLRNLIWLKNHRVGIEYILSKSAHRANYKSKKCNDSKSQCFFAEELGQEVIIVSFCNSCRSFKAPFWISREKQKQKLNVILMKFYVIFLLTQKNIIGRKENIGFYCNYI